MRVARPFLCLLVPIDIGVLDLYIRYSEYTNALSVGTDAAKESGVLTPVQLSKCLADETRLSLLCLLFGQEEVCVCDLVAALNAPQSTVSRHLAQLRQCELVSARRDGTWMHYRLHPELPKWAYETLSVLVPVAKETYGIALSSAACCEEET